MINKFALATCVLVALMSVTGCADFPPVAPVAAAAPPAVASAPAPAAKAKPRPRIVRRPVEAPPGKPRTYARGEWLLAREAYIVNQPNATGVVTQLVPVGGSVNAEGQVSNPEGVWWFVRYRGQAGWVRESAFNDAGRP